ncbi:MAG TPA: hypothetical protein DEH07_07480 [Desulfotomaculum sp.]|nr:hypothetical protein [Desulfotomaculum sp.]
MLRCSGNGFLPEFSILERRNEKMALNQNALFNQGTERNQLISLERAEELRKRIADYLEAKDDIPTGSTAADKYEFQKRKISALLGASEDDWQDWRWQFRNRINPTFPSKTPNSPCSLDPSK